MTLKIEPLSTQIKHCHCCKRDLDVSLFSKERRRRDGLQTQCKECKAITSKKWFKENKERNREREKEYRKKNAAAINKNARNRYKRNIDKIREYASEYCKRPHAKKRIYEYNKKRRATHLYKFKARETIARLVLQGKIIRPKECSLCGSGGKIEAHHEDYNKHDSVVWLCTMCHKTLHRKEGNTPGQRVQRKIEEIQKNRIKIVK